MHNIIYYNLISYGVVLCFLLIFAFALSRFEESIRIKGNSKVKIYLPWSLKMFKHLRIITFSSIALEYAFFPSLNFYLCIPGFILVLLGIFLRVLAIRTLGPMWSFHVALLEDHYVVDTGIYRFTKHPAYLGNMYLVGLALIFSATLSSFIALICFLVFWFVRVPKEEHLIFGLSRSLGAKWNYTTEPPLPISAK